MEIPLPILELILQWKKQGIAEPGSIQWTSPQCRHVGCPVPWKGQPGFAKLAMAAQPDLDEPNMFSGMQREVWWSLVIKRMRDNDPAFPFTSPDVLATNVDIADPYHFSEAVTWVVLERIEGQPIVDWDPSQSDRLINDDEFARWRSFATAIVDSLRALERIHTSTLENLSLPPLPSLPHGMRRCQKKGMIDMQTAVLGNGAFEIKNFWRTPDGQLVLMDNEFAGWYPRYDHLSYLYHRLYCNTMRPDLAKSLLNKYRITCTVPADEPQFFKDFCRILRPRVIGGALLDMAPRRSKKFWPWHRKQRLRYKLLWDITRRNYRQLYSLDIP